MTRAKTLSTLSAIGAALLALPLRSDGVASCDNVTTSLASTINDPVAGDEKFFSIPSVPANVMFLLDASGSMANIPQCGDSQSSAGDFVWGGTNALSTCKWPSSWATPATPASPGTAKVWPPAMTVTSNGTCNAVGTGSNATLGAYLGSSLDWMAKYTPTATLVDPGHGTASNGLVDQPTWGTGCTGNNCLFQPTQLYSYYSPYDGTLGTASGWSETSAVPLSSGCQIATINLGTVYDCSSGHAVQKSNQTVAVIDPLCQSCTGAGGPGFYFYNNGWSAKITTFNSSCTASTNNYTQSSSSVTNTALTYPAALFSGGWLNANPPKFMMARKVIKDVAWIDPNVAVATDQLRLGLSFFSSAITNNAAIIVPLGPSEANSYPINAAAFVTARQSILDALNHRNWPTGGLPRIAYGGTPMATGLFHLGQYFTQPTTYTSKFGSSYELSAFAQDTAGKMQAPWVTAGAKSICWNCENSAVIVVTDGSPNSEMTFPTTIQTYDDNAYKNTANCGPNTSCSGTTTSNCCSPSDGTNPPSRLPRVADWLHNNDLRPSDLTGNQVLTVSAVSFNLPAGKAQTILQATANMSGGSYKDAKDGKEFASSLAQAVALISNTSTAFGAPAASALATVNSFNAKAFVTRFRPGQKPTWEGHLFQWLLFDEAAAGCDPTKKPDADDPTQQVLCRGKQVMANFNGDATAEGYNDCSGSFLVDADCDQVTEDPKTGVWTKKGTSLPAHMFWDAGQVLSTPGTTGYRTAAEHADTGNVAPYTRYAPGATPRNIWTALPDGTPYELETKNAATLAPYMNLDWQWCATMESLAKLCGAAPLPACPTAATWSTAAQTTCAQHVILFARGWDVMDQDSDGCAGPTNPSNGTSSTSNTTGTVGADGKPVTKSCVLSTSGTTNYSGEERDRPNDALAASDPPTPSFYKLGDIFHSAPVLVHQPASEPVCELGSDNQCVRTIFGFTSNKAYTDKYQTSLDAYDKCPGPNAAPKVDAYRAWRASLAGRESVVLVGANDGFLHAFDAGGPDLLTGSKDADCVWPATLDGTGEELWAFLPPDLLPRLRDLMLNHQYMVDGNVMLRDVWVDGVAGDGNSLDGKKQRNEFRTIAVFGERSGGTQYTALDVTSSFDTNAANRPKPTMLWTFPPPRSADAQYMGQSWSDFAPRAPPIGPVRLVPGTNDRDPDGKGWVERWVVMINGGYDPTLNRGRAVWMVDAWTGKVVWRFTDSDFKTNVVGAAGNTTTSMFPVPAAVGLVDIGKVGDSTTAQVDSDNFFDTATWGDMGGNVFVARFFDPGQRDATTGLVTNWKAARTFEQSRRTDGGQFAGNRTEFFYMTSNAYEPQRRALRTLLGSGNREQILEQSQGCGPDNIFSCCQAGCAVTTTTRLDYGVCNSSGSFSCSSGGQMTSGALAQGCGSGGASACTGGASNTFSASSGYSLDCGGGATSTASGSVSCDATGVCTVSSVGTGHDVVPSSAGSCPSKSRFYGFWSYGGLGVSEKTISTVDADWSTAQTFDRNRFTDAAGYAGCTFTTARSCSLVDTTQASVSATGAVTCADGSTRCQASVDDPGWFYQYNTGPCPTQAACASGCTNEKSASGAGIVNSCATWNSFIPLGSAQSGNNPCGGAGTATQTAVAYASNFVSGTPDKICAQARDTNTVFRGLQQSTIAPPAAPMVRMGVSSRGQVYYSTLQMNPGQPPSNTSLGSRDLSTPLYWLDVSREAHACRHVTNGSCN